MTAEQPNADDQSPRIWTIPNALCVVRILGSPGLVWLAYQQDRVACLVLFVVLWLTDWLDGKLAKWLRQSSPFGARLDSYADAIFYGTTLLAMLLLAWDRLWPEWPWLLVAVGSYAGSVIVGMLRFGKVPSFHTRAAKVAWLFTGIAVIAVLLAGSIWFVRLACALVTLANVESIAIGLILPVWQVNVLSVRQALKLRAVQQEPRQSVS